MLYVGKAYDLFCVSLATMHLFEFREETTSSKTSKPSKTENVRILKWYSSSTCTAVETRSVFRVFLENIGPNTDLSPSLLLFLPIDFFPPPLLGRTRAGRRGEGMGEGKRRKWELKCRVD